MVQALTARWLSLFRSSQCNAAILPHSHSPSSYRAYVNAPGLCEDAPPETSEHQLQPELHHTVASRTDERIAGRDVGRGAPTTEPAWARGIIAEVGAIRCAVRIGDNGVIEQVEDLGPELGAVPFLELEVLEYREIHVLEGRVAEDVAAHGAKGSLPGRKHHRSPVRGHVAPTFRQSAEVGRLCRALLSQ